MHKTTSCLDHVPKETKGFPHLYLLYIYVYIYYISILYIYIYVYVSITIHYIYIETLYIYIYIYIYIRYTYIYIPVYSRVPNIAGLLGCNIRAPFPVCDVFCSNLSWHQVGPPNGEKPMGLPAPTKSSCWIRRNQRKSESETRLKPDKEATHMPNPVDCLWIQIIISIELVTIPSWIGTKTHDPESLGSDSAISHFGFCPGCGQAEQKLGAVLRLSASAKTEDTDPSKTRNTDASDLIRSVFYICI